MNRQGSLTLAFDDLRVADKQKPVRLRATVLAGQVDRQPAPGQVGHRQRHWASV